MTIPTFTANEVLTSTDMQAISAAFGVATDTTPGTAKAGFTDSSSFVRTCLDGHLVEVRLQVTNTSAITATTGNITDTDIYTLDAAYTPASNVFASYTTGNEEGTAVIQSSGVISIWTATDTIGASSLIRLSALFLVA